MVKSLKSPFIEELGENSVLRKRLSDSNEKIFSRVSDFIVNNYFKENVVEKIKIDDLQKRLSKSYSCSVPYYVLDETLKQMPNSQDLGWGEFKIFLDKKNVDRKITELYFNLQDKGTSLQHFLDWGFSLDKVNHSVSCSFEPYRIKILFHRTERQGGLYGGEFFSYDTEDKRNKDYGTLNKIKILEESLK